MADTGIDRIIQITISKSTLTPTQAAFNIPIIAAEFLKSSWTTAFTTRTQTFTSLAALAAAGCPTSSFVYLAAQALLAQNPSIQTFMVGRKETGGDGTETWTTALNAMLAENPSFYGVIVGARDAVDQTVVAEWVEANKRLCMLATGDLNCVNRNFLTLASAGDTTTGSGVITGIADTSQMAVGDGMAGTGIPAGATIQSVDSATQVTLTENATATGTAVVLTLTAGDIFAVLASGKYTRTGALFHSLTGTASEPYVDAAIIGKIFPYTPGTINWAFKQLATVPADAILENQIENGLAKYGNLYTAISGVNIVQMGQVGSSDYFDVIHGTDWLQARIQNRLYTVLVNSQKVPFTDGGIQGLVAELKAALNEGVQNGFLASYSVTAPTAAAVSSTNKGNRILPDVTFTAELAGAINNVQIQGTLTN